MVKIEYIDRVLAAMTNISTKIINKSLVNLDNLIRRILKHVSSVYLSEGNAIEVYVLRYNKLNYFLPET